MNSGGLDGIRVLDLADESAAFTGRLLADLGAEVILVENPEGNPIRHLGPFVDDVEDGEHAYGHLYFGANKKSIVIDRKTAEGRADFEAWLATADVLIETAPPARRRAEGLDDASLRAVNPDLIHASITPFGPEGAWRDWRATDLIAEAASGLLWLCGERRGPPWHGSGRPTHSLASLAGTTGILAALRAREQQPGTGGAHLEIALQEAATMAAIQSATPTLWSWFGRIPGRPALSNALQCRDGGWVGLLVRPVSFDKFREWSIEAQTPTQLAEDDAHWADLYAPRAGNPVSEVILELAERFDRDAFAERAAQAETICLPILDFPSMAEHPQLLENRQFMAVACPQLGRSLQFTRSAIDAVSGDVAIRSAPELGADQPVNSDPRREEPGVGDAADISGGHGRESKRNAKAPPLNPYLALDGIRVVDFCWVLAGPLGTRLLANFGADVIRIESMRHLDSMRKQPGPDGEADADLGGLFHGANAGKRSLTVDLSTPAGRELILELVAHADVVTNNFRPGTLDRMGLGYSALRERQDRILLLNLPGTHAAGPWASWPTTGNAVMAASGLNMLMGFPGQRPRGYGVAYPDFTSPYLLATAIMAALRERDRRGEGREMDLSQLSATIALLGPEWMRFADTGEVPPRTANRDANYCPHGVFPARGDDAWLAIAVSDDPEWRRLCELMQREELADDHRFANHAARKRNEDALDEILSTWTRERDRWQLSYELQAQGIPAAPVENLRDTYERDPQLRDHYQRIQHPLAPQHELPIDREAIRFAGIEHRMRRGPMWGEHNEEIVCELLGLDEESYTRLLLDEVLG
jgi:crotonobetainyl-CoA:carnitine CoA-transferase CaiB-like acyl-CoA transferase